MKGQRFSATATTRQTVSSMCSLSLKPAKKCRGHEPGLRKQRLHLRHREKSVHLRFVQLFEATVVPQVNDLIFDIHQMRTNIERCLCDAYYLPRGRRPAPHPDRLEAAQHRG